VFFGFYPKGHFLNQCFEVFLPIVSVSGLAFRSIHFEFIFVCDGS
jgi:hypothetical protein